MLGAQNSGAWEYLLPDALGSVRQIADAAGNVTLAKSYEPYGSVLTSTGTASSILGYAGEQADTTGLIYLRARYMNPRLGLFLARDPWSGDVMRPGSMNGFNYVEGNPVNAVDPSGHRQWPKYSSSATERAVEWLHEQRDRFHIHLEYPAKNDAGVTLYPDVLHSDTGDVYEIEPRVYYLNGGEDPVAEATFYRDLLTYLGGQHRLEIHAPNDWNKTTWRLGLQANYPFDIGHGDSTIPDPNGLAVGTRIPHGLDLIAASPEDGAVVWWYEPNRDIDADLLKIYLAGNLAKHIVLPNEKRGPWMPPPRPAPVFAWWGNYTSEDFARDRSRLCVPIDLTNPGLLEWLQALMKLAF